MHKRLTKNVRHAITKAKRKEYFWGNWLTFLIIPSLILFCSLFLFPHIGGLEIGFAAAVTLQFVCFIMATKRRHRRERAEKKKEDLLLGRRFSN